MIYQKFISAVIISAASALIFTAAAQTTQKLSASKANEFGVVYTLPKTAVSITLAAEKTVETPGEFYLYAKKYLNSTPISSQLTRWTLKEAVINPVAMTDENEKYLVTLKGGTGTFIMVDPTTNAPVSINDEAYRPTSTLSPIPEAVTAKPTILEMPVARQAQTEEMLQSRSSVKRAEFAAAKIYELRTNRNEVVSGQADAMPSDGNAMKLALATIDSQEEALTAMFLGTTSKSVEVTTLDLTLPDADEAGSRTIIARLSATKGIVGPDDLSGAPIYMTVTPVTKGELPLTEKGEPRPFPKGGVAYRIPGSARITLELDGRKIAEKTISVAQYGVVYGADPALFTNKKAPSYARFDPMTGALIEIGEIR